jgi:hypothetical protein
MHSLPVLTIADLRSQSVTNWEQEVTLSIPFGRGSPLKVVLAPGLVLPKTIFKYQLQQAVYEGSAGGGVRWWCKKVNEPCGHVRQAKFDISVRFECPISCVDCPAFVRFQGSRCCATDDETVALVVTAKFKKLCKDPLNELRKEFQPLKHSVDAEILASKQFAFVFRNPCQAEDAHVAVHGIEHSRFHGTLHAEIQDRFIFSVFKCNLKHERCAPHSPAPMSAPAPQPDADALVNFAAHVPSGDEPGDNLVPPGVQAYAALEAGSAAFEALASAKVAHAEHVSPLL